MSTANIALVISILSLCLSLLLVVIHYRNQIERRHGEIAKLRTDLLISLSHAKQRLAFELLQLESARILLRNSRDCECKFTAIELMPELIKTTKREILHLEELFSFTNALNSVDNNISKVLIHIQSVHSEFKIYEDSAIDMGKDILKLVALIQSFQNDEGSETDERDCSIR